MVHVIATSSWFAALPRVVSSDCILFRAMQYTDVHSCSLVHSESCAGGAGSLGTLKRVVLIQYLETRLSKIDCLCCVSFGVINRWPIRMALKSKPRIDFSCSNYCCQNQPLGFLIRGWHWKWQDDSAAIADVIGWCQYMSILRQYRQHCTCSTKIRTNHGGEQQPVHSTLFHTFQKYLWFPCYLLFCCHTRSATEFVDREKKKTALKALAMDGGDEE